MEKEVVTMQGDIKDYYMDISTQAKVTFNRLPYSGTGWNYSAGCEEVELTNLQDDV